MPQSILVGIDASTPSRSAIAWSVARSVALGHAVELIHVIDTDLLADGSAEAAAVRVKATELLESELVFARHIDPTVTVSGSIAEGRPVEVLVARSQGHSLLVVGTHKTGFIYGRTFGSRFIGLGWRARCDTAFIPDRLGYDRQSVIVGVGDSALADSVVLAAAAEAQLGSQDLILVSSWGAAVRAPRSPSAVARRAAALARSLGVARVGYPGVRIRTRAMESPVAEALVESSARAALLVIGRRRNSWGSGASRASNLDVLLNMSSPVMVV